MTKTTVTIVVEHHEKAELINAVREVYERIAEGYVSGSYEKENQITCEFKTQEEGA